MKSNIALLCPGQGSQFVGMGYGLAEAFPEARAVFEEADEVLSQHLSQLMFHGPIEDLTRTANAQPALAAVAVAAWRVLASALGVVTVDDVAAVGAGHSLGEYSMLTIAGALQLSDTVRVVRQRGLAMEEAVPPGVGGMVALLGVDMETAESLAAESRCEVANDNGAGQIVMSGTITSIDRLMEVVANYGVKKAVRLQVAAPFHSSLMTPAAARMAKVLAEVAIQEPTIPVIGNYHAQPHGSPEDIRHNLVHQITGNVRWAETVQLMLDAYKCTTFVELGAGKVLGNLIRRISPQATVYSLQEPGDVDVLIKALTLA